MSPPVVLQNWLWTGHLMWYDQFLSAATRIHFIVPPTLAFALWLKRRALFYRFAATLLTLSYAGALTFALYPAAPPWAAAEKGLIPFLANPAGAQAAAVAAAHRLRAALPPGRRQRLRRDPVAARRLLVPDLPVHRHPGVEHALALDRVRRRSCTRVIQCFAAVYTANHYVVDLLIGFVYATAALYGVLLVLAAPGMARVTARGGAAVGARQLRPAALARPRLPAGGLGGHPRDGLRWCWRCRDGRRAGTTAGFGWYPLFRSLGDWDATWYGWIAQHGYDPSIGHGNTAAFFPLYPILWSPLTWLPGPITLWGTLLSSALFGAALCLLYRMTQGATTRAWRGAPCCTWRSSR